MKKFMSLLIGCSLALAGVAMAQQPEEQQTPSPKTNKRGAEKTHAAGANAANNPNAANSNAASASATPEQKPGRHQGARNERAGARGQKGAGKGQGANANPTTGADQTPTASATPGGKQAQQRGKGRTGRNARGANAMTSPSASPAPSAAGSATPATGTSAATAPSVGASNQQAGQANATGAARKKPDPQQVQQIKQQHTNFRAQPKPQQVPAVTFNQNYRIQGSDRWQGQQYEVFRSYHPERHDQGWYRSHYPRVELIGGGYYYWNNGYWFPAWGYNPSAEYYAYDGPIYVGHRAEPPDRVIADVQAELQQMGYYHGEVDGLLGPLTREALTAYQADQGLTTTAAIDEPTLDSLGMG